MKAIQTRYKGYNFRSRLEARWAVFLDDLGVSWCYEPEGFELPDGPRYLPDFHINDQGVYVPGRHTYGPWLEVKAVAPTDAEIQKLVLLCEAGTSYGLFVWGNPGDENWMHIHKEGFVDDTSDTNGNVLGDYLLSGYLTEEKRKRICHEAANAARSARFEHGESGATW